MDVGNMRHNPLKILPAVVENAILDGRQKKKFRQYHQQLEKIAAERAHLLTESNQRLTDESSQRTRALHELKESKEIYRRFFQTSHDAIFITGADGGWIDMNQSAIDLFGFEEKARAFEEEPTPENLQKYANNAKNLKEVLIALIEAHNNAYLGQYLIEDYELLLNKLLESEEL